MADDLIISSTTDTPEQIAEAMRQGADPVVDDVLSTEAPPAEKKEPEKAPEKAPEKKVEAKVEEKKPEEEKTRYQKRIDGLVAEREEQRRRADELQAKLDAAAKKPENTKEPPDHSPGYRSVARVE